MHFENTTQLNLQFNDNELSNIFIPLFFILKHLFDILTFLTCLYNFPSRHVNNLLPLFSCSVW